MEKKEKIKFIPCDDSYIYESQSRKSKLKYKDAYKKIKQK